jgi:NAD+ kinase
MERIGLIVNEGKPRAAEALRQVARHAREAGLTLLAVQDTIDLAGGGEPWRACAVKDFVRRAEAVIVLGGDGTLLRAAHCLQGAAGLPLMGFNIGSLGYLASVDEAHFGAALRALREDRVRVETRPTLAVRVRRAGGGDEEVALRALNDVVVSRGASGRLARLSLAVDGAFVTTYACDGVIVATATGSTAYSLSAGGPIVMPGTPALAVSVICPHALGARPLVVPETARVAVRVERAAAPLLLAVDGAEIGALRDGDGVEIGRGAEEVRLALLPGHDPYAVLGRKLGWGGREAAER